MMNERSREAQSDLDGDLLALYFNWSTVKQYDALRNLVLGTLR